MGTSRRKHLASPDPVARSFPVFFSWFRAAHVHPLEKYQWEDFLPRHQQVDEEMTQPGTRTRGPRDGAAGELGEAQVVWSSGGEGGERGKGGGVYGWRHERMLIKTTLQLCNRE